MSKSVIVVTIILLSFLSLASLYDLVLNKSQAYTGYVFLVSGGLALVFVPQLSKKQRKAAVIEETVKKHDRKKTKKTTVKIKKAKKLVHQEEMGKVLENKVEWIGASGLEESERHK